jgi:hypothetical protein
LELGSRVILQALGARADFFQFALSLVDTEADISDESWMMVLEPPLPVESAPLPYSTKNEPFAVVMESGALSPFGAVAKVLTLPIKAILIIHERLQKCK